MMRRFPSVALAVGSLLVVAMFACGESFACSCAWVAFDQAGNIVNYPTPPPLERSDIIREDLVFLGLATEVIDVNHDVDTPGTGPLSAIATFSVERYWKGRPGKTVRVYGGHNIDCGFSFEEGSATWSSPTVSRVQHEGRWELTAK